MGNFCTNAEKKDIFTKGLPKEMKEYVGLELIRSNACNTAEKLSLIARFGKNVDEWNDPRTDHEKQFVVEHIINQLLQAEKLKVGTLINLRKEEIRWLINESKMIFSNQESPLVEIEGPIMITGDFHGQYYDLIRIMKSVGGGPPKNKWVVIGDYVDRGNQSIETVCLLLAYKVRYSDKMFMLRGNHECESINRLYGFYDECKRRYNIPLWRVFIDMFNYIPVAAVIDQRILCMHGGLSPHLNNLQQINQIALPQDIPDSGLICDLLWADPRDDGGDGFIDNNDRGVSVQFGADIVQQFCQKHNLDLICRAHQCVEEGYEFFADRKLVTIFSAPNYVFSDNKAAIIEVDEQLLCKVHQFDPVFMYRR